MKIIFFANGSFSVPSLQSLINSNHNVLSVVTNHDKKRGRGRNLQQTEVSSFAVSKKIPVIKISDLSNTDFIQKLKSLNADLFIVISYRILPEVVFSIPSFGTINIHASLLPKYKGAAPIQRSIMNGDTKFGLTSFIINSQIDSGTIIDQFSCTISNENSYGEVHDMLAKFSGKFLINSLILLNSNKFLSVDTSKPTYAKKVSKEEYKVSLNNFSIDIHNKFRGLTPPGPYLLFNNKRVKLYNTSYKKTNELKLNIGEWAILDNILLIGCTKGLLCATKIQFPGKKIINIKDFKNMNISNQVIFI